MAKLDADDLNAIQSLIDLSAKQTKEDIRTELVILKNDVFDKIDSFAKEAQTSQQERSISSHQITRNTKRIERLETKIFKAAP